MIALLVQSSVGVSRQRVSEVSNQKEHNSKVRPRLSLTFT